MTKTIPAFCVNRHDGLMWFDLAKDHPDTPVVGDLIHLRSAEFGGTLTKDGSARGTFRTIQPDELWRVEDVKPSPYSDKYNWCIISKVSQ